jgi:hypothetical protein
MEQGLSSDVDHSFDRNDARESMLDAQDAALRAEADALLQKHRVLDLLRRYGTPHLSGSYAMQLMTWRDLDIYVAMPDLSVAAYLDLGRELGRALGPRKLSFTDHLNFPATEGLPGLYWGIRTDDLASGGWKIDVWGVTPAVCAERIEHCRSLAARIDRNARQSILTIKNDVCRLPAYRNTITSHHIYEAVLSGRARTVEDFWKWLNTNSGKSAQVD